MASEEVSMPSPFRAREVAELRDQLDRINDMLRAPRFANDRNTCDALLRLKERIQRRLAPETRAA
jgi:hypothetical protein